MEKGKQPTGRGMIRRGIIRQMCRAGKLLFPRCEESKIFVSFKMREEARRDKHHARTRGVA